MLSVRHTKLIPYPFDTVLSQYFDYEHIEHVHPHTLGRYRVHQADASGIRFEQTWPKGLLGTPHSVIRHTFRPPGEMWFDFEEGRYTGVRVHTVLEPRGDSTFVDETYEIPLPNWRWLGVLARPWVLRMVERIWKEDLDVEVCRNGWPGVPGAERPPVSATAIDPRTPRAYESVASASVLDAATAACVRHRGHEWAVFRAHTGLGAVDNRCPHTGGPLSLGRLDADTVVCPWHGARFELATGRLVCGPATKDVTRCAARCLNGDLQIELPASPVTPEPL